MKNRTKATPFAAARGRLTPGGQGRAEEGRYGSLHQSVVEQIGKRIVNGDFQPGETLPNADDLGEMLGISRTVLREAVKVLAGKGLVVARPKTGTKVLPRSNWNFLDPDILLWRYSDAPSEKDVNALFELRRAIEPVAAALAARNAEAEEVAVLQKALEEMEAAGDNGALFAEPDLQFHKTILTMTGNELIGSLGALIETALMMSFRLSDHNPAGQSHSLPMHKEVLNRIVLGDGPGAHKAMAALIDGAEQDVRRGLDLHKARPQHAEAEA